MDILKCTIFILYMIWHYLILILFLFIKCVAYSFPKVVTSPAYTYNCCLSEFMKIIKKSTTSPAEARFAFDYN